jgi:dihydroxy-acid dehydratase
MHITGLIKDKGINMSEKLNKYSSVLTQDKSQGASQAMLYGTGLTDKDMSSAQVGIASMWYEGNTCNMHLSGLADEVKKSVTQANLVGMRFNTIGVSDGISMGTDGMSYSLQSRDLIADSIETVMAAHWYDACVAIPGCDKNMPGCLIALGRLNRPGLVVYGGTIQAGCFKKQDIDIVTAFQSYGARLSGEITEEDRVTIVKQACPGAGACGGMYTANTMSCAIEAMGMSLPYSSSTPATDPLKKKECAEVGMAIKNLLELDLKPRDIMTKKAFENAITVVIVLGGSTNAVLHLIAAARSVDIDITLNDFHRINAITPLLADMKPSGKYLMADIHHIGGTPAVMKYLLENNMLHGDCLTVTGKTLEENLKGLAGLLKGQKVIQPLNKPIKDSGHLRVLKGNLAREGSVAKITGKEGNEFTGKAICFDSEEAMIQAFEDGKIKKVMLLSFDMKGQKVVQACQRC